MNYYGPWKQDPDYEATLTDATPAGEAGVESGATSQIGYWLEDRSMPPGSWAPAYPLASAAMVGAAGNNDGTSFDAPSAAARAIARYYVGGGGNPLSDPWISEGEAWHNFRLRSIAPYNATGYYFYPDLPDGAVGIEWQDGSDPTQGLPATTLGCILTADTILAGFLDQDGTYVPSFMTDVQAASHDSVIYPDGSANFHSWDGPGADTTLVQVGSTGATLGSNSRPLGGDLELTPYLDTEGRVALYTKTPGAVIQGEDNPGTANTMTIHYGWWLSTVVTRWTFRPPVYRLIYSEPQRRPYRRIFPRDDGLAGGAPRTYPASKSQQSSNRIVGGYF